MQPSNTRDTRSRWGGGEARWLVTTCALSGKGVGVSYRMRPLRLSFDTHMLALKLKGSTGKRGLDAFLDRCEEVIGASQRRGWEGTGTKKGNNEKSSSLVLELRI